MTNIKDNFKSFLLNAVSPNFPSYSNYFRTESIDKRLIDLELEYKNSFQSDLFEIDTERRHESIEKIKETLKSKKGSSFEEYNERLGSGIANAIVNTHLTKFIQYFDTNIEFTDLQNLIDTIHKELGSEFIRHFQEKRVIYNGKTRIGSSLLLFGEVRDNYWTINIGSEKEIQYHIFYDKKNIGYGLAFNAQGSRNNTSPIDSVKPFVDSYLNNPKIKECISDYRYIVNEESKLKNISAGDFICIGKTIPVIPNEKQVIQIKGESFLNLIYDLKGKQNTAYQLIFEGRNELLKHKTNTTIECELLNFKKQIILQGPPGTGKTYTAKDLAYNMVFNKTIDTTINRKEQLRTLEQSEQYEIVQFHPAYSYEDFVRGISAQTIDGHVVYKTVNKTLGDFAERALKNHTDSKKQPEELSLDNWLDSKLEEFKDVVQDIIDENAKYPLSESAYIYSVEDTGFRYKGDNWAYNFIIPHTVLKDLYSKNINERKEIKALTNTTGSAKQHATYYFSILEKFKAFIGNNKPETSTVIKVEPKNYVLIIDEINRANLPAVLGELIYALEYRGESISSMYDIDGDREIILPPNLFIIGTMNTADRSVEALDTALRRRFVFEEMMPDIEELEKKPEIAGINLAELLKTINQRIEILLDRDHQIGHAYFIHCKTIEDLHATIYNKVIPLLQEYFFGDYGKIGLVLGSGFVGETKVDEANLFANFRYEGNGFKEKTYSINSLEKDKFVSAVAAIMISKSGRN